MLQLGQEWKFYNGISSWTYDYDIAHSFTNPNCAPDWYYDENEWEMNYPYLFAEAVANQEPLIPAVFVITPCNLHAIQTADYIDVENDNEYVGRDEKEVITTDCSYRVFNIEDMDGVLLITLEPLNGLN